VTSDEAGRPIVLRSRGGMVTFGLVAFVSVFLVVDAAMRGRWDVVAMSVGWVALALWLIWAVQVRPSIRVTPAALTVVNVLRVTRVPWPDVADITMRYQIAVATESGVRVRAWGGPALPRPRTSRDGAPSRPGGREMDVLLDAHERWRDEPTGERTTRFWDVPVLIAGGACVLAAVGSLLVALLA
jgi:hypothetical protein